MVWQKFQRGAVPTIAIRKDSLVFNRAATELLSFCDGERVNMLWDKKQLAVAFMGGAQDEGWTWNRTRKGVSRVYCGAFISNVARLAPGKVPMVFFEQQGEKLPGFLVERKERKHEQNTRIRSNR